MQNETLPDVKKYVASITIASKYITWVSTTAYVFTRLEHIYYKGTGYGVQLYARPY